MNVGQEKWFSSLEKEFRALYKNSAWLIEENLPAEEFESLQSFFGQEFFDKSTKKTDHPPSKKTTGPSSDTLAGATPVLSEPRKLVSLRIEEAKSLDSLRLRILDCQNCELSQLRKKVVFGQGHLKSKIMVIGEAPGAEEDKTAMAFVGKSGKLFTQFLLSIGLNREDMFITNMVKCRPPGNRNPQPEEISACNKILQKQIELLQPKMILAVGAVSAQNLLRSKASVSSLRGKLHSYQGIDLWVIFHPSYFLRRPEGFKEMWDDMRKIRRYLIPLQKKWYAKIDGKNS